MKKSILWMSLFLLLISGCTTISNTNLSETYNESISSAHHFNTFPLIFTEPTPFEINSLSITEKIEKGIDVHYSPDGTKYYVTDSNSHNFRSIILGPDEPKTIFEFKQFFGDDIRDFHELTIFWGGLSDCIYLAWRSGENLNGGIKLWSYKISDNTWTELDLSFLPQERIRLVSTVDHTSNLIFEYEEILYAPHVHLLVDMEQQSVKKLKDAKSYNILDQRDGILLLTKLAFEDELNSEYYLCLYDISSQTLTQLPLTIPLISYAAFIPNTDYISFNSVTRTGNNSMYSNLNLYETKTHQKLTLPIYGSPMTWNADFSCIYNYEYISCVKDD